MRNNPNSPPIVILNASGRWGAVAADLVTDVTDVATDGVTDVATDGVTDVTDGLLVFFGFWFFLITYALSLLLCLELREFCR